jgi:hypothetical protein
VDRHSQKGSNTYLQVPPEHAATKLLILKEVTADCFGTPVELEALSSISIGEAIAAVARARTNALLHFILLKWVGCCLEVKEIKRLT